MTGARITTDPILFKDKINVILSLLLNAKKDRIMFVSTCVIKVVSWKAAVIITFRNSVKQSKRFINTFLKRAFCLSTKLPVAASQSQLFNAEYTNLRQTTKLFLKTDPFQICRTMRHRQIAAVTAIRAAYNSVHDARPNTPSKPARASFFYVPISPANPYHARGSHVFTSATTTATSFISLSVLARTGRRSHT